MRKILSPCDEERNKKDKLHNEIIHYLDLNWSFNEVYLSGAIFLKSLCEVLWYINGHHSNICSHGYQILACFTNFQGSNAPELSNYRKRSTSNMFADVIGTLSTKLFRLLQAIYFSRK